MISLEELTEDQASGLQSIMQFIDDPEERIMVVKGYAGTGKSTLIQLAVKELRGMAIVAFTAPTNKATKVLREMAVEASVPVDHVSTIYSLLGLTLTASNEIKEIGRGAGSMAGQFDLIILDEASMTNEALMNYIEVEMSTTNIKVIMMGDPLQLPPVGEEFSRALVDQKYTVELTEIVRQAGDNPIIQLTADIRASINAGHQLSEFKTARAPNGEGVHVLPKGKWEAWMRAGFCSKQYAEDGDAFRAVAWRNVTVDYLNRRIRDAIYKERAKERFLIGEHVLNANPIQDFDMQMIMAPTDSEGMIRSVDTSIHPYLSARGLGDYKVYHLSVAYEEAGLVDVYVLHEDSEDAYNAKLSVLSREAKKDRRLWGTFWEFKDSFHDIRPAHAVTSHRSQGSTYSNVFVDVADIRRNWKWKESMQSLYVACSRARHNLMLLL